MQLVRETLFKGATLHLACRCKQPSIGVSEVKVAQSCLTLCDPMVYTVHGILQVRVTGKQNMTSIYTYKEYTHTRDYYSAIKRNMVRVYGCIVTTLCSVQEARLVTTLCSVQEARPRRHIVWFHLCEVSRTGRSLEIQCRWLVARGWRRGKWKCSHLYLRSPLSLCPRTPFYLGWLLHVASYFFTSY